MEDQSRPQSGKNTYPSVKQFTKQTRQLLKEEEKYEIELFEEMTKNKSIGQIEALGYGLASMTVVATKRGFYGKDILTLTKAYHSEKNPLLLPEHCKIQVGDDVALFKNNTIVVDGVVSKRAGSKLQVTIRKEMDDDNDLEGLICNVVLKWNEVTFRRYFKIMDELDQSQSPLLGIFFQPNPPPTAKFTRKMDYENKKLNEEQNEAVAHCLKQTVHLLHGPPGTGKTTTVCELIVQAVKRKEKVLACGPSNIAVDNIVEGLSRRVNCVRVGNPARMIEGVIENCLDYLIAQKSVTWKNQVKKLQNARKRLGKASRDEKRGVYAQIKQLRDEIFHLQEQAIQQILDDVDVICCTNVGAYDRVFRKYLPKRIFDLVVIDECGQSLEIACWIPILKGRRVVLAGDHKQLPPTIQGNQNSLLGYTLFSRAMEQLANITSTMLKVQYRMNKAIMGWSNKCFYENKLKAHSSVEDHKLQHLCNKVAEAEESLLMIDTSGCGMGEEGGENESKMNVGEADLVMSIYKKLLGYEVNSNLIAVITPYSKQVAYIKTLMTEASLPLPDISTVDGIQGRQKECIIISLVRSNSKQGIGFLKDWRRMNVAVTRARRMLVLIGNAQCASADKHMHSLVQWIEENGHITSAEEFRGDQAIRFGLGASDKIEAFEKKGDKKAEQKQAAQNGKTNKQKKKKKKQKDQQQKPQQQHGLEEQIAVKEHYRKVFSQILREITLNNVTAFQRKMIHEIAEQMGLCHQTSSDKKFIKVWRKLTNDEIAQKYAQLERLKLEQDIAEAKKKEKKKLQKQNRQAKNAKTANTGPHKYSEDMKKLVGYQQSDSEEEVKQQKIETKKQVPEVEVKVEKKKKKKQKEVEIELEQQNIEQLMREFVADQPKQDQCFKCKKRITSVTAVLCKFCSINYCRYHVLAQQHGCQTAAREEARKGKTFDKHLQEATERLKNKIKQQQESRKRKGKESKGSKK